MTALDPGAGGETEMVKCSQTVGHQGAANGEGEHVRAEAKG